MTRLVTALAVLSACGTGGSTPAAPSAGDPVLHRLTEAQVNNALRDLFLVGNLPQVRLPRDIPVDGFENNALVRDVTPYVVESLQRDFLAVSAAAMDNEGGWMTCGPAEAGCAERTLEVLQQRAWRRPATDEERSWLLGLYQGWEASEGAEVALALSIQVLLQSPDFLYLVETPDDGLSDFEVATRMSFFLWDSMPDAELFRAAAAGELKDRTKAVDQARRMFVDPRARQAVRDFHRQWLDYRAIGDIKLDESVYFPSAEGEEGGYLLSEYRIAFEGEIDAFVDSMVFGPGTLDSLLTSRDTWVSPLTAELYGATVAPDSPVRTEVRRLGADIARVPLRQARLPAEQRAGILTTGGFLASHAHPVQPSPVLRGVFIRERLMCVPTPKPPDDVPPLEESDDAAPRTNRDRYAEHTNNVACRSCHESIDGAGFPFENYDSLGGWRTEDNGFPVDSSGAVVGTDVDRPVTDAVDMIETLAGSRQVHDCMVTQWFRYATHRTETEADAAALAVLQDNFWASGGSIPNLLVDIATADFFLDQTPGGAQ